MEQSMNVKRKINTFGKVGKIITTILIVLMFIAEGALLIGTVVLAILPKEAITLSIEGNAGVVFDGSYFGLKDSDLTIIPDSGMNISIGNFGSNATAVVNGNKIIAYAESGLFTYNLWDALGICVAGMIGIAAVLVVLFFLKALMKEFMTCDSPFCDGVVNKMRNFAISLIPAAFVGEIGGAILGKMFINSFSLNLGTVLFVILIFMLVMIFKYGAQLQKQYDETV